MIGNQKGLSEIAFVPNLMAGFCTLVTAFWWIPHLWRQSITWGLLFSGSALICFFLLPFITAFAFAHRHGIPSITIIIFGFGITGIQVFQVIKLTGGIHLFSFEEAFVLNHSPVYLLSFIIFLLWLGAKKLKLFAWWLEYL
ncbi:hypothetical protein ACFL9T_14670 [Thermodesulfobacteriota bacterium]